MSNPDSLRLQLRAVLAIGLFAVALLPIALPQAADAQAENQTQISNPASRRSADEARSVLATRGIKWNDNYSKVAPKEFRQALIDGDLELVMLFVDAGVNPNALNEKGFTALHTAACNDRIEIIEKLLERGASLNVKDKDGDSLLVMAVACNRIAAFEYFLKKGVDVNSQGTSGTTALSMALEMMRKENGGTPKKIALTLLESGANPNLTLTNGYSPLMYAACVGDADMVKALIERGADVTAKDNEGDTALTMATRCDHEGQPQAKAGAVEIVKLLLAHGADAEAKAGDGMNAVKLARERKDNELVRAVLEQRFASSLWTQIKYWCYSFNKVQGWGGPVIYLLAVIISGIALKRQKPLKREKVEGGDGLPRLEPLKCKTCAAPIPISLARHECPSCGAEARIPEDYTETLKQREKASAALHKAERTWTRASFYTQSWFFFLMFGVGVVWLVGSIFGFFSEYSSFRPVTLFVSTALSAITFPAAFYVTSDYFARESNIFPKLPEVSHAVGHAEDTNCKTCAAPARFEARDIVTACGYCGTDLYRAALAREARIKAGEEAESAEFSLYDAATALQERRRALFKSIEAIGSLLLLIIAITAVSLIVIAIIIAVVALYLYLTFS